MLTVRAGELSQLFFWYCFVVIVCLVEVSAATLEFSETELE